MLVRANNPPRLQLHADWGQFHLLELLASGPTTEVYLARSEGNEHPVALKIFHPELVRDPLRGPLIRREVQLAMKLDHSNIIRGLTIGSHDERLFLAMEHVDAITCAELLERLDRSGGRLPSGLAVGIALDLLAGLGHAHELRLVHGAIAPDALLLTRGGETKLTGFRGVISKPEELSWAAQRDEDRSLYHPPERARGAAADLRGDIFGAAMLLYRLLTQGQEEELRRKILNREVVLPSQAVGGVSPSLDPVVLQGMAVDPSARFPSTSAFSLALQQASDTLPVSALRTELARLIQDKDREERVPEQGAELPQTAAPAATKTIIYGQTAESAASDPPPPESQPPLEAVPTTPTNVISETAIHRQAGEQGPEPLQDVPTIPTHVISETAVHRLAEGEPGGADAAPAPEGPLQAAPTSPTGVITETAIHRMAGEQPAGPVLDDDQALPVLTEALSGTGAISETKLKRLSMAAAGEVSDSAPRPATSVQPEDFDPHLHTAATEPKQRQPSVTPTPTATGRGSGTELLPVSPARWWLLVLGLGALIGLGGGLAAARISSSGKTVEEPRLIAPGETVHAGEWAVTLLEASTHQKHLMLKLEVSSTGRKIESRGSSFYLTHELEPPVFWSRSREDGPAQLVFGPWEQNGDTEILTFAPPGAPPTKLKVAIPR